MRASSFSPPPTDQLACGPLLVSFRSGAVVAATCCEVLLVALVATDRFDQVCCWRREPGALAAAAATTTTSQLMAHLWPPFVVLAAAAAASNCCLLATVSDLLSMFGYFCLEEKVLGGGGARAGTKVSRGQLLPVSLCHSRRRRRRGQPLFACWRRDRGAILAVLLCTRLINRLDRADCEISSLCGVVDCSRSCLADDLSRRRGDQRSR